MIEVLSSHDGLVMAPQRKGLIDCTRKDIEMNMDIPQVRVLLNHLQAAWGKSKVTCRSRYQLFHHGYGQRSAASPAHHIPYKQIPGV